MALVVSGAPVVELVDTVAAVAAAVQVATVSPLCQCGLGLSPMALALPQVSKVTFNLLRGLYHPALGLSSARKCCLVLDLALLSMELPLGSPSVESRLAPPAVEFGLDHPSVVSHSVHPAVEFGLDHLSVVSHSVHPAVEFGRDHPSVASRSVHPAVEFGLDHPSVASRSVHSARLSFCFSSPSSVSVAWGLSWVLGFSPALPSWISSWVVAPWIHLLPYQVLVLGTSLVMPLGLLVCLDPPPAL